ncbi:MAG TPA: L-rhamnose/proton symporter RhaT [Candidatus Solibacter sp.]|nr:L-rhamnose/proton symporter RhaT [Candidatus Solibacter sp.]
MSPVFLGLLLLVLAGAMNGSFTLPMKFTRKWAWENTWLAWTIFALCIFPPLLTLSTVPQLGQVYAQVGATAILIPAACGAGWGVSQVFFGLAVDAVGIALAFSVILGTAAAVGSLIPLIDQHREKIFTSGGLLVLLGVALVLAGVAVCAVAGRKREAALGQGPAGKPSVVKGLIFCLISGLGSALVNFGLAYGGPVISAARTAGAAPLWAPNAVWLPLMCAGGVPNLIYCIYLARKNRTGSNFGIPRTAPYWALAAVMAFFWFGSTVLYGVATVELGDLGTVLGWPLFMSLIVITASVWGVVTGEWKNTGRQPLTVMFAGVGVLVIAIFVLSAAGRIL